jgi:hypothetical protein
MRVSPRRLPIVVTLSLLTLACSAPASADPIQLVSGSILYSRANLATFTATGADGSVVHSEFGNFAQLPERWDADHSCLDCVPGSTIDLSQSESLTFGEPVGVGGSVRVGEVDFWIDSLVFHIASGSFMLPDSSNGTFQVSRPFSFDGVIMARSLAGEARTFSLVANGTATARFGGNDWFSTTYQFAAATPEPGTLLLMGGPAALALLRRRRTAA